MRGTRWVAATAVLLCALPASAQWKALAQPTNRDDYLAAVAVVSDLQFVTGGMRLSSGIPLPIPVLYKTLDGGSTFQPIGTLQMPFAQVLAFSTLSDGWMASGGDVYRTANGTTFQKATLDAGKTVKALHRLDADTGVAVGSEGGAWRTVDGGATWSPVDTGTAADLDCLHFIDGQRGWAAGSTPTTTQDENMNDVTTYGENVVLGTTDGGASWHLLASLEKGEEDGPGGRQSCPIFFLPDGTTGWLFGSLFDTKKQRAAEAVLFKTGDGGRTWRKQAVDFQVGTTKMFSWTIPIKMSYAVGMYWSDDGRHGRLAGSADTGMSTSGGGGGGDQPVYKLVDMTTTDGGLTWKKPDFGEITMDPMGGGQAPAGDPRPFQAAFKGWYEAVMVGEKGTVWTMGAECAKTSECLDGYECRKPDPKVHARCYPVAVDPEATSDRDAYAGMDANGYGEGTLPTLDVPACEGAYCAVGKGGAGCIGGPAPVGPGAWPAAMLLVLFLAASRRSRR